MPQVFEIEIKEFFDGSLGRIAYPSEAQAKIIIQAIKKAEEAGM